MPLVVISGFPSSGKSTRAQELHDFFLSRGKNVQLITENIAVPKAGFEKNEFFASSQKEKVIRADLKSDAIRQLNKTDVLILDAGNYIKGYRYELFCASKAARTPQCTLFCGIPKEEAWTLNINRNVVPPKMLQSDEPINNSGDAYTREIFDALCLRYEEPHGNSRWDSPLFSVFPTDQLAVDAIFSALYESKAPPPNQSTQNPPLSGTNYLFEIDRLTQEIVTRVMAARKIGQLGAVPIDGKLMVNVPSDMNASQLNRLRRQFLSYNKFHAGGGNNLDMAAQLFVQFLNSNFNK